MEDISLKIAIGSDHAGYEVKEFIRLNLESSGYSVTDYGVFLNESSDYPDVAHPLSQAVEAGVFRYGILLCGSGNGMAIVANKYKGIRATICWNEEITLLARKHNDANILVLPARFIFKEDALKFSRQFLTTGFDGGRHQRRVDKIFRTQ
jgi:ribose 5-phosphate isomerase B